MPITSSAPPASKRWRGQTFTTPMMCQYLTIKERHLDCLLLYRMGDFYELFLEDAEIGSKILDITLTQRSKGKDGAVPMAGVPFHAVEPYIARLVQAGYRVAVCDQLSEPNGKGIVQRDVVRVVTPGTTVEDQALIQRQHSFVIAVDTDSTNWGWAAADLSTGTLVVYSGTRNTHQASLANVCLDLDPREWLLAPTIGTNEVTTTIATISSAPSFVAKNWPISLRKATKSICSHFGVKTVASLGLENMPTAITALAGLLEYIQSTQPTVSLQHLTELRHWQSPDKLKLDWATVTNLELLRTIRDGEYERSFLHFLDQTTTAMGARLLREWLLHPLKQKTAIEDRLSTLDWLINNKQTLSQLKKQLTQVGDIERLLSRLAVGIERPHELLRLAQSLTMISQTVGTIRTNQTPLPSLLARFVSAIEPALATLAAKITATIIAEPPTDPRQGGIIADNIDPKLDTLRQQIIGRRQAILRIEAGERQQTGISSLKVRYTKNFGYFIEVSNANLDKVPASYFRKQTLVNAERFTTPELKEHETHVVTTQETADQLEYELFSRLVRLVLNQTRAVQAAAQAVAQLDCLLSLATISQQPGYVRPQFSTKPLISIKQGRHPVVEKYLTDQVFVANNISLHQTKQQLCIITGPNMAGKSVIMRQTALISLLAHLGCFVPASEATIGLLDHIFVRSGAADGIASGMSTFMVEMVETAAILRQATDHSLVILDEIGRGTSTYDGISLAWAIGEHLTNATSARPLTLFATHYHELTALANERPNQIANFHVAVAKTDQGPVFLHQLEPGPTPDSFGIEVAELAGLPASLITRAQELLQDFHTDAPAQSETNISSGSSTASETKPISLAQINSVRATLSSLDISATTPLQALNLLAALKEIYGHD